MIAIKVDEGYAYDFLAILDVKRTKNLKGSQSNYEACFSHIESQIGKQKHSEIINSDKYRDLTAANLETFDAVEKARYGQISAKEVDDLNMKRYYCKVALQRKFFPDSNIAESKS